MSPVTGEPIADKGRYAHRWGGRAPGRPRVRRSRWRTAVAIAAPVTWVGVRLGKVQVTGTSMVPTLAPGDRLLVLKRGGPWRPPRPGDIVTLADPRAPERTIVKRFARATPDGADVRGDAAASTDTRTFGHVPPDDLLGRAVYRYAPPQRAGRLSC